MQQLQFTTAEQSEQTAQTFSVVPPETVTPSEVTETNALQQEQADTVANLLTSLERDIKKRRKWNRRHRIFSNAFILGAMAFLFLLWQTDTKISRWGVLIHVVNFSSLMICSRCKRLLDKKAAMELTQLEDVRSVGALIDVWCADGNINYPPEVTQQARITLTCLLPRLQAGDAHCSRRRNEKHCVASWSTPANQTRLTIPRLPSLF